MLEHVNNFTNTYINMLKQHKGFSSKVVIMPQYNNQNIQPSAHTHAIIKISEISSLKLYQQSKIFFTIETSIYGQELTNDHFYELGQLYMNAINLNSLKQIIIAEKPDYEIIGLEQLKIEIETAKDLTTRKLTILQKVKLQSYTRI